MSLNILGPYAFGLIKIVVNVTLVTNPIIAQRRVTLEKFHKKVNFPELTRKHLLWCPFSVNLQSLACKFSKKKMSMQIFSCEYYESFRTAIFVAFVKKEL